LKIDRAAQATLVVVSQPLQKKAGMMQIIPAFLTVPQALGFRPVPRELGATE